MILTVPPWLVVGVLWLALFGLVFLWRVAREAVRDAWTWWYGRAPYWLMFTRWAMLTAWCRIRRQVLPVRPVETWPDDPLEELPPEQSAEALGFTGPPPPSPEVRHWRDLEAKRERLASAAELEHRAAYEAMGFDFPSGLMARVRELTP